MENIVTIIIGVVLLVIGCLMAFKGKIVLLHSYHYKRVSEEDKPKLCKVAGLGNIITGVGIILCGALLYFMDQNIAFIIGGITAGVGIIIMLSAIIKYNKGLF